MSQSRVRSSVVGNSVYSEREGRKRKEKERRKRGGEKTERGGGELGRGVRSGQPFFCS